MKLKNFFEIIGFKGKPQRYGYRLKKIQVPGYPTFTYAQWLHPFEKEKEFDPRVIQELKKYIHEGDFCIDIGAHSGDTTLPMALVAGKSGLVLALEPNPYVFPVLEKNARINREQMNVFPIMAAAANQPGSIELEYSDPGYCNGGKHEGMSVFSHGHAYRLLAHGINLAQELKEDFAKELKRFRFLKTDAEGFDLYILQSLSELIDQYRPYVKSEVFKKTSLPYRQAMLNFFLAKGYTVFRMQSEWNYCGALLTEDNLLEQKHYDIFCIPGSSQ